MKNKQYFLFISDNNIYAIETFNIVEIVEYKHITKVPMLNSFVKGVINIRGNILCVIDLLERFGFEETKIKEKTSLIILKIQSNKKKLDICLIIDEVYEVENIENKNIEKKPDFGIKIKSEFIKDMLLYKEEYIPILNLKNLLNLEELSSLKILEG